MELPLWAGTPPSWTRPRRWAGRLLPACPCRPSSWGCSRRPWEPISRDPDHEDLVAEIYEGDDFVALVTQEQGWDALDIELHPSPHGGPYRFKLGELEAALQAAKQKLWDLRRTPGDEA
jgi:hypothetical protein